MGDECCGSMYPINWADNVFADNSDNSQFGEGEEAKVCLDIMQRTGAHIELSLAKDQGLSIMVTGKLDSVMNPVGVTYDPVDKMVYWSDVTNQEINRASLDGTQQETIATENIGSKISHQ